MADNENLKNYKDNIEDSLHEAFPDFNITVFKDLSEDFELPAIVINKPVLEPKDLTVQNIRFRVTLESNAFVIYSAADDENGIECVQQAAYLAKFLNNKTFGEKTPLKVTLIEPVLQEGLENYFIQRIDFEHIVEI